MEAAIKWVLDLLPLPMLKRGLVKLTIHKVDSGDCLSQHAASNYPSASQEVIEDAVKQRWQHESRGAAQLKSNAEIIRSEEDFYAFLLLGGHLGYRKFTMRPGFGGELTPVTLEAQRCDKAVGW